MQYCAYVVLYIMHVGPLHVVHIIFGHMCLFFVHAYIVYVTPTYTHAFLSLCVLMLPNKIVNGFKMNIKGIPKDYECQVILLQHAPKGVTILIFMKLL